eukprot:5865518-Pyramimonas_sp.AAC.1
MFQRGRPTDATTHPDVCSIRRVSFWGPLGPLPRPYWTSSAGPATASRGPQEGPKRPPTGCYNARERTRLL